MKNTFIEIFFPEIYQDIEFDVLNMEYLKVKKGYLKGHSGNKISDFLVVSEKDWDKTFFMKSSEAWHFHTLSRSLILLLHSKIVTKESQELVFWHIKNWWDWDNKTIKKHEQVWSGHTVALRLDFLLLCYCLLDKRQMPFWLIASIEKHMEYLLNDENYDGNWNHGLDQNIILLKTEFVFKKWNIQDKIIRRIMDNFYHAFDEEGVTNEQAILYHHYGMSRFSYVLSLFNFIGVHQRIDLGEAIRKASIFLKYSLAPNGRYLPLGDTPYILPNFKLIGDDLNKYCNKILADKSYSLVKIYKRGYIFGRSSWEKIASQYSIRFGSARIIHGHNDHMSLTYFFKDRMVLLDGGFGGYQKTPYRNFLQSPLSHNVVFIEKAKKFSWNSETYLMTNLSYKDICYYVLQDEPYENVKRFRSIFIDIKNDIFFIVDKIISTKEEKFTQNWNFSSNCIFNIEKDYIKIIDDSNIYKMYYHIALDDEIEISELKFCKNKNGLNILGGVAGENNEKYISIKNLRTHKTGKKVFFSNVFCMVGNVWMVDEDDFSLMYYGQKYICIAKSTLDLFYSITRNRSDIILRNEKHDKIKYDIPLIAKSQYLLLKINLINKNDEFCSYYYVTSIEGVKLRFGRYYLVENKDDEKIIFMLPALSLGNVEIELIEMEKNTLKGEN
ncbi:TPA: heparinase II/III family protein [Campylobacter jejuni]|nr:heparinase II/III family protein [Campylobacter jejuni]